MQGQEAANKLETMRQFEARGGPTVTAASLKSLYITVTALAATNCYTVIKLL